MLIMDAAAFHAPREYPSCEFADWDQRTIRPRSPKSEGPGAPSVDFGSRIRNILKDLRLQKPSGWYIIEEPEVQPWRTKMR